MNKNPMEMAMGLAARMAAENIDFEAILKAVKDVQEIVPRLKHEHALLVEIAKKLGIEHTD